MGLIQNIKYLVFVGKIAKVFEEKKGMKLSTNLVVSVALGVLQVVVQSSGLFSGKWVVVPLVAHGLVEMINKVIAATHNPDGTPAAEAYKAYKP